MILYVATTNPGKLRDFAWAAEAHGPAHARGGERVEIAPLKGLGGTAAPAEDGETFEANARAKAAYYSTYAPGEWVIADDSGLEVDALGGRPGVRSARFADDLLAAELGFALDEAGMQSEAAQSVGDIDARNNATLLRLMEHVPAEARRARYRCVLALAREGEVMATAEGTLEGRILFAERGSGGFGYDPLFLLPEVGVTMAEVDPATRLRVGHRGRALRQMLETLQGARRRP